MIIGERHRGIRINLPAKAGSSHPSKSVARFRGVSIRHRACNNAWEVGQFGVVVARRRVAAGKPFKMEGWCGEWLVARDERRVASQRDTRALQETLRTERARLKAGATPFSATKILSTPPASIHARLSPRGAGPGLSRDRETNYDLTTHRLEGLASANPPKTDSRPAGEHVTAHCDARHRRKVRTSE